MPGAVRLPCAAVDLDLDLDLELEQLVPWELARSRSFSRSRFVPKPGISTADLFPKPGIGSAPRGPELAGRPRAVP